ncbi:MAG: tRNA (adenosine(37)-N6)-dimethylallyltransferase MiaA [Peptostreptococcus sp.]|uniref:tRNA dimethylallyltransferase n=1 Tax=Peptostreptococcus anaerobius TaxID=1261 RepID=A0A379CFW7_9FIRM|nr:MULTISPECIES: tRNA (adenosine(37)-N6)-dimethylallyltransferase MiaA [Peptostreptococcus]EKX89228.1 tRNA dimethylallyltransferase [Peptostreptococcus anaerobius VPI 4330 = DSM 2949]MCB6982459.1 tRNA (adenosine(37)-N6)-dimethylallyltransferase MiaA [Peptostreptococcus anaerobius]MCQ5150349.1 tRNA (adenosine(37)-N6)-dimethylallyltransferase MiaA [Peptostreptococcus anaerobius]MDU1175558.1 tRNA (adenosine(37)-N6)-dimethylallyltransferase MiaA [Peptostreptococcus anaerobius]MDU1234094.1 tRNA (ad
MTDKIPILILTGPTAVGKTALSIELAKILGGEIISADSMQIYRKMDIGSAKISQEEMDSVVHHMIDVVDPDEDFSVADFHDMASQIISDIHKRGKLAIVTGGTGLYLNSLVYDMDFGGTNSDPSIRKDLEEILNDKGKDYLYRLLQDLSPEAAKRIHPNNTKRVIRAIEVYKTGGDMGDFSNDLKYNPKFDAKIIVLNRDRSILYDRINQRVDMMFDMGLLDEVKGLHQMGYTSQMQSMKGIGYKEVLEYFDGKMTLEESIDILKQGTRRYAKRQITWFKRYENALWLDLDKVTELDDQIEAIKDFIK